MGDVLLAAGLLLEAGAVGLFGFGISLTMRACAQAMLVEDAADAERLLVRGLRTTGGGVCMIFATTMLLAMTQIADHAFLFLVVVFIWSAFALFVYAPALRRVWRVRQANDWSAWPTRIPL